VIVDASAIVAIIKGEPDAEALLQTMRDAETLRMPTPTALELTIVLRPGRVDRAMDFLRQLGVRLVDFTGEHLVVAQHAHLTYGRGSGSPARLNYGDCMVYAVAKVTDEPLLFKGDDFLHTDVTPAR